MNKIMYLDLDNMGAQLKEIRESENLTRKAISMDANVSHSFICRVERGRGIMKLDTLMNWTRALGYTEVRIRV